MKVENIFNNFRHYKQPNLFFLVTLFASLMNRAYREQNPEIVLTVSNAVEQPVAISSLIYAIQTLTGTEYQLYDESEDFLSPQFIPRVRYSNDEPWTADIAPK